MYESDAPEEAPPPAKCKHANDPRSCEACALILLMSELGFRADANLAELARGYTAAVEKARRELVAARDTLRIVGELADACPLGVPPDALRAVLRGLVHCPEIA